MKRKAVIFGINGYKLSREEKFILKKTKPWGIILFSRNIQNLIQAKKLVNEIRKYADDDLYPILIDQEGGKVSRINNIFNFGFFSASYFGNLFTDNKKNFYNYYKIYVDKTCEILKEIGVNINTVPVLDVLRKNTHQIIGERSFSKDHLIVKKIGKACINLYSKNKIGTVMKHIPGHGLATNDSHTKLPIVSEKKKILNKIDFAPFKDNKSFFAMTSHIIYKSYDPYFTTTHSQVLIDDIIRKKIGFKGILITDDISMKALKFGLKNNVIKALDAGCNLVLHCNGNYREMSQILKIVPNIDDFVYKKTSQFYQFLS